MSCTIDQLRDVSFFSLLDDEELAVLAEQVEMREFSALERIYKAGAPGDKAYVVIDGKVQITIVDEDHQEVVVDESTRGEFFGFASLLDQTSHQTSALAMENTRCIEVDRNDLSVLLQKKPMAGMDIMATLGRHFHRAEHLVRLRSMRNANEIIEEEATIGERLADRVARFGGSWAFIISFAVFMVVYTIINIALGPHAWDPYPYILLNLILSMLAAIQAPVILMSQNRQDKKDRVRSELDYAVNRRSEVEIQGVSNKLQLLQDQIEALQTELKKSNTKV